MTSVFRPGSGDQAEALRRAQLVLMDDKAYSHPFYWAAFSLVWRRSAAISRRLITSSSATTQLRSQAFASAAPVLFNWCRIIDEPV